MMVVRPRGPGRRHITAAAVIGILGVFAAPAGAFEITFDEGFISGEGVVINTSDANSQLYVVNDSWLGTGESGLEARFSAVAGPSSHPDIVGESRPLVVYDTGWPTGQDPDLEAPFEPGVNSSGLSNSSPGNILVFQEYQTNGDGFNCNVAVTFCTPADDEGINEPVGTATILFNEAVVLDSIDFYDIDDNEDGGDTVNDGNNDTILGNTYITLYSNAAATDIIRTINVPLIGDNRWDHIKLRPDNEIDPALVYAMTITMGGSGGFDNLAGSLPGSEEIPEPMSLVLLSGGMFASLAVRRRRSLPK